MPIFNLSATESANTAIMLVVPPVAGLVSKIDTLIYTSGSTAHTITVMRATAVSTADGRAAAAQQVITFANPSAMKSVDGSSAEILATWDYVAWQDVEGKYATNYVTSISGSAVTLSSAISAAIPDGGPLWIFGELARATALTFTPPVSTTTTIPMALAAGVSKQLDSNSRSGVGDVMLVYSDNATAAGSMSIRGTYSTDESTY